MSLLGKESSLNENALVSLLSRVTFLNTKGDVLRREYLGTTSNNKVIL